MIVSFKNLIKSITTLPFLKQQIGKWRFLRGEWRRLMSETELTRMNRIDQNEQNLQNWPE